MRVRSTGRESPGGEVRLFVSYSHKDEALRARFEQFLADLKGGGVTVTYDGDIHAGESLDREIARKMRCAHIFVALFSQDYIDSRYCQLEYRRAMNRLANGTMRVVAIILRPCTWKGSRAVHYKALPKDGKPVIEWRPIDKAWLDVTEGLGPVVDAARQELPSAPETKSAKPAPKPAHKPARKPARKPAAPRPKARARVKAAAPSRRRPKD